MENDRQIKITLDDSTNLPEWLEYRGAAFELKWMSDVLVRITKHSPDGDSRDIGYEELPEVLRRLL